MRMTRILLYLAKPIYGGWVSFTSHLARKENLPLYKIGARTEKKKRPYGYSVEYQNINLDSLDELMIQQGSIPIITAIDKNYYHVLEHIAQKIIEYPHIRLSIVLHDPTEFSKGAKKQLLELLKSMKTNIKIITIRKTVHDMLLSLGIESQFIIHPYVLSSNERKSIDQRQGAVSISRIDYDKNIDIIVKANAIMNTAHKIVLYGDPNERYIYQKLVEYDSFKKTDPESMYRGNFPKSADALHNILESRLFVVDMSSIYGDGGGTQYTFLEAIEAGCILILNHKWVDSQTNCIWKHGYNCFIVANSDELSHIIRNPYQFDLKRIYENSRQILIDATNVSWHIV
jgi:glycosyltransferase involved in cell wall biosynthesis